MNADAAVFSLSDRIRISLFRDGRIFYLPTGHAFDFFPSPDGEVQYSLPIVVEERVCCVRENFPKGSPVQLVLESLFR